MHPLDVDESCGNLNKGPNDEPNEDSNKTFNERPIDGMDNGGNFLKKNYLKFQIEHQRD